MTWILWTIAVAGIVFLASVTPGVIRVRKRYILMQKLTHEFETLTGAFKDFSVSMINLAPSIIAVAAALSEAFGRPVTIETGTETDPCEIDTNLDAG